MYVYMYVHIYIYIYIYIYEILTRVNKCKYLGHVLTEALSLAAQHCSFAVK